MATEIEQLRQEAEALKNQIRVRISKRVFFLFQIFNLILINN
jgi:hypothetical protein